MNPPAQQESSLRDEDMSAGRPPRAPQARFPFGGPMYWIAEPARGHTLPFTQGQLAFCVTSLL